VRADDDRAGAVPSDATPQQVHADMNPLMRGVLYPAANVVFSAQTQDPGDVKLILGQDPSMSTDPLTSTYAGWPAIENAALALAESANLLTIPGRRCANGTPVPTEDPAWAAFVQQLRDVSVNAYRAAQQKDLDAMIEISEPLSVACERCHRRFRNRRASDRCT
jgi:hypothetical protein